MEEVDNITRIQDVVQDMQESGAANVTYGPTNDGGYNTPYAVTVFYNESQIFQIAIAALSEMCQSVPIIGNADLNTLGDVCEHPSPDLIVFDDISYTEEHFRRYFKRGFQKIHVFTKKAIPVASTADTKPVQATEEVSTAVDVTVSDEPITTENTQVEPVQSVYELLSKLDNRITTFTVDNMNEGHVKLISNLTTVYIMDMITCGVYREHHSFIRSITHERGRELIDYLNHTSASAQEIGATLIRLATQFNGYERAEELCSRWQGMREERKILAQARIASSTFRDDTLFVYGGDLRNEIFALASTSAAKYIVLWTASTEIKVVVLKGSKWTAEDKTPAELVSAYASNCTGTSVVECTLTDKKFLPFL